MAKWAVLHTSADEHGPEYFDIAPVHEVGDDIFMDEPHSSGRQCACRPAMDISPAGIIMYTHKREDDPGTVN